MQCQIESVTGGGGGCCWTSRVEGPRGREEERCMEVEGDGESMRRGVEGRLDAVAVMKVDVEVEDSFDLRWWRGRRWR